MTKLNYQTRVFQRVLGEAVNLVIIVVLIMTGCSPKPDREVSDILGTISIVDGFKVELVAMEPLISDPVAMEIDENGITYVVEMHGYPLDKGGSGIVKRLYDDNKDGVYDRSEVFYEQLKLPTGIMKWKRGVLVTDPPDLLYLEDTDNDGVADMKEVVVTGFALSNPQHNFNTPIYGLDNWIYLANEGTYQSQFFEDFNDEGTEIYFPGYPDAPRLPKNANDLNVRLNLIHHRLEMLSGDSQYGHTFDQWGHHFGTRNWSHIYHEVLAAPYIQRNDHLELPSSMQYVPDYGIGFEIYPITQNPEHQLLTDVGAITSSCGITWYMGGLFPEPYQQVVFIAEPTHNLVHTDVMYEKGATFGSRKQFENQEFLASTDGWFRPVNFYTGPDGSMYMLDFHRKIIEHPEWMSEEVLNSGELYQGLDKGRIFRITPTATPANFKDIKLGQVPTKELIPYLQHPNIWWRRHAQRLLVDSQDQELITTLKEFFSDTNDLGALHTLWTLEGIKHFDEHLISMALEHSSPAVRENGLKIAEIHREKFPALESKLVSMVDDPHPKVRFQLLCTLGYFDSKASAETRRKLMFDNLEDPWMQLAGLSALSVDVLQLLTDAVNEFGINRVEGTETLFRNLGKTIAKNGNNYQTDQAVDLIAKNSGPGNDWWRSLVMRGISESLNQPHELSLSDRGQTTLKKFFTDKETPELRSASLELLNSFGYLNRQSDLVLKATNTAVNRDMSAQFRADALKVLAWADANGNSILFQQILATEKNPKLRSSAIESLKRTNGNQACDFLVDQWKNLTPAERDLAVGVFNTSSERQLRLLKAIESNRIQASVLGWGRTVRLLNNSNEQVRTMAREVLEGNETISDSVWQQYQEVLAMNGDPIRGEMVFASACSSCHQLSGQHGVKYGPDLSAVRNRSKSGIMIDILKPNRSISDGYDLWTIEDTFGKVHSGIVSDENANTLTLRNAAGEEVFIQQSDIVDRAASEISGMPEGLHNQISHQEMADLLEYLKKGVSGS